MGMTQKHWKIAFFVIVGLIIATVVAGVIVLLVILLSSENFCDQPSSLPRSIHVSENGGDVRIQWTRSIFSCNGKYVLRYSINGGQQIEVRTTNLLYTVVQPRVCSDMLIELRTAGEAGRISDDSLNHNYTVLPLNALVTNTDITRTDTSIVASWQKPAGLETCDIQYTVRFSSELTDLDVHTTSESIIIPENIFCFNLRVQVSSTVRFSTTWFGNVGNVRVESTDIYLSIPSENPFVLIATWSHPNEDICSISYIVIYRFGSENQTFTVPEPRATFDVHYCVTASITILPSAFDGTHIGWSSFRAARLFPDDIEFGPVENVNLVLSGSYMTVMWDIPAALSQCEDLYNVTARNDNLGEEASCQGTSGCVLSLSNFCPRTEFIISPYYLLGESVHKIYSC